MAKSDTGSAEPSNWLPASLAGVFLLAIVAFAVDLGFYRLQFAGELSGEHSRWAEFGDFLGGTLGPAFSLLGLLALLLTLYLQNREFSHSVRALSEQAESLGVQRFENTFFEMIRLHHEIVKALDLRDSASRVTTLGRDCFGVFYQRFRGFHGEANSKNQGAGQQVIAAKAYDVFYLRHRDKIDHYFRNFHRILKLVDESNVSNKSKYTGILRAQVSSSELGLMFYNALHPVGRKLRPLLERYAMFENLDPSTLCNPPDEVVLFDRSAFGDQDLSGYGVPA